jgi:acetamidase/formamidase
LPARRQTDSCRQTPGRTNLSKEQACQFCSLAVDFHITQTMNGENDVHELLKKGLLV